MEGGSCPPSQNQEHGKLCDHVTHLRRTGSRRHPQRSRPAPLGGVRQSSLHVGLAELQLEETEQGPIARPRIGEHVRQHRVIVKGPHKRGGSGRHVGRTHEVNLWHRRHGSCVAVRLLGLHRESARAVAAFSPT